MLIESIIQRAGGTRVPLGDDIYHFFTHIKNDTRHVCEVQDEDHIQTFLAIKEGYRLVKQPKKAQPAQPDIGVTLVSGEGGGAEGEADPEVKKPAKAK